MKYKGIGDMRVVAGKHRGLVLNTFDADNIRPTTDRVRENIFNKIQFDVQDCVVLDLFCGTGAISIEFLSRGACKVISVDNNENSIKLIKSNFLKAKEGLNLIKSDYKQAIRTLEGKDKFDFIFIDPPYNTNLGEDALREIAKSSLMADDCMIIYEHLANKKFNLPDNLEVVDYKKYGTVAVTFIKEKIDG